MRPVSKGSVAFMMALTALVTTGVAHPAGLEIALGDAIWTFEGTQVLEYLGYAVGSAGDLNGDDYGDVVVGTSSHDVPGRADNGRAWVFYGSAQGLSTIPDVDLAAPELSGGFGVVTTGAGNVNGDEYDDLIVSMNNYHGDPYIGQQGAVFVYYGSASGISTTHSWMARGDDYRQLLGWGAGSAGDVNGDGYDDIIAGGAYVWDPAYTGRVFVWYGSANGLDPDGSRPVGLPANADWSASGSAVDYFGTQVGTTGDVNNDGYSDVWVAASWYDNGEQDEGKVFVWYGSDTGLGDTGTPGNADWAVESNDADSYLGGEWLVPSATSLGDVNGDGYDDFLVAAAKYDAVTDREGIAMLFYGSSNGLDADGSRPVGNPANADWYVTGANEVDILGYSTGRAGDFNADGFNDFLIGVFAHDATGDNGEGLVQLWLGSSAGPIPGSLPRHVDCFVEGVQLGEHLGTTAAGAGDVNGDGYDDFITGAIYWDTPSENEAGRAYLFTGMPIVFAEDFESGDLWRVDQVVP